MPAERRRYYDRYAEEPLVGENPFIGREPDRSFPKNFHESRHLLPEPHWEGHDDALECYWKTWELAKPASTVPPGVENFAAMLEDEDVKVRWYATLALGAYAPLRDGRVDEALQKALANGAHKVHHAAARILGAPCRTRSTGRQGGM